MHSSVTYGLQSIHNPYDWQFVHISQLKPWVGDETDNEASDQPDREAMEGAASNQDLDREHKEIEEILNDHTTASGIKYWGHCAEFHRWVGLESQ